MVFDIEMIKKVYQTIKARVDIAKEITSKPLTLAEKILYAHLYEGMPKKGYERGDHMSILHQIGLPFRMQLRKWPFCNLCKRVRKE